VSVGTGVTGQLVGSGVPVQSASRQPHSTGPRPPPEPLHPQLFGTVLVPAQPMQPPLPLVEQRALTVDPSQ
jgi:hypothetical protein